MIAPTSVRTRDDTRRKTFTGDSPMRSTATTPHQHLQTLQAPARRRQLQGLAALALMAPLPRLLAQTGPPQLQGNTSDGRPFALSGQQGRVVLVFYWSTSCAVCRDKMGELRANLIGWRGQPFVLIGVNTDTRQQDFLDYESLVRQTITPERRFDSLWAGQPGFVDTLGMPSRVPSACLIDKQGKLVERYSGRIPAQAWDRIAELL